MFRFINKKIFPKKKIQNSPSRKILLTIFILFIYRFCYNLPLVGIDQEALKQSFLELGNNNSIMQVINMYSGGGGGVTILSPFSLGIIPFINASIFIDLLTAIVPTLEKLQTEEGEFGRRRILFYKKLLTLIFSISQSTVLLFYLKPYIFNTSFLGFLILGIQLIFGAFVNLWLTTLIDNKGIGNGTSLFIFSNIILSLLNKNIFHSQEFTFSFFLQINLLLLLMLLICISQTATVTIDVVSARQLAFLENSENSIFQEKISRNLQIKENGLAIKFNQAGIFPIIIASNILPFFSYFSQSFENQTYFNLISNFLYYLLIIGFNYFYTLVFWDPEKISEQLRKASVSVVNITPGKETVAYLENVVRSTSILGGMFLCFILFLFDLLKQILNGPFLNQINITSLIILVGVAYEVQRTMKGLYKNVLQNSV